eukprot:1167304-Pleurochrysis_carterae.AAC.1
MEQPQRMRCSQSSRRVVVNNLNARAVQQSAASGRDERKHKKRRGHVMGAAASVAELPIQA